VNVNGVVLPHWAWPIIVVGVVGLAIYQTIKASETVAHHFGVIGKRVFERASARRRLPKRLEHIEKLLMQASDKLECATAYLCLDAEHHNTADVLIAEHCPGVTMLLPQRVSYTEFCRRWNDEGWRP
jgi:hypothetical protein